MASYWKLKGCPRCGGDLLICLRDDDTCLQCGYTESLTVEAVADKEKLDGISKVYHRGAQKRVALSSADLAVLELPEPVVSCRPAFRRGKYERLSTQAMTARNDEIRKLHSEGQRALALGEKFNLSKNYISLICARRGS